MGFPFTLMNPDVPYTAPTDMGLKSSSMSKTLASSDFELGFVYFILFPLILDDIMIVLRVMGLRGRCMRNIQGSHCKNSLRTHVGMSCVSAVRW
jgi:hypothetical protein